MTARLWCFGESGNAYKAALTLTLCGIEWEPVFVDFFNGASRSPAFRAVNVMGEAPVLEAAGRVPHDRKRLTDCLYKPRPPGTGGPLPWRL